MKVKTLFVRTDDYLDTSKTNLFQILKREQYALELGDYCRREGYLRLADTLCKAQDGVLMFLPVRLYYTYRSNVRDRYNVSIPLDNEDFNLTVQRSDMSIVAMDAIAEKLLRPGSQSIFSDAETVRSIY